MQQEDADGTGPPQIRLGQEMNAKIPAFPYDLNKLCNYTFSFDVLKDSIEFLAKQQADINERMNNLETREKESAAPVTVIEKEIIKEVEKSSEKSEGKPAEKVVEKKVEKVV